MGLTSHISSALIREQRRIETLEKVKNFYLNNPFTPFTPITKVFKEPRICELCGEEVKRGLFRLFSYKFNGKKYVASEVHHEKCVANLLKELRR